MGHEAAGTISSVGSSVITLKKGDRVALEPQIPCRRCPRCKDGNYNLCPSIRFAASPPDAHGTLVKYFKLPEDFCYKLPEHVTLEEGVLAEPTAVAVHMARLANLAVGDRVVVTGSGTVGLLCAAVARAMGAGRVVVCDVDERKNDFAASFLEGVGTFKSGGEGGPEGDAEKIVETFGLEGGADVLLEASGAQPAIATGLHVLRKGGRFVQGGMGKAVIQFPIGVVGEKELVVKGCFRYSAGDFKIATELIFEGKVPVKKLVSKMFDFEKAPDAWEETRGGKGIKNLIRGVKD